MLDVGFGRDDLVLTIAFVISALVVGEITRVLGIGGGVQAYVMHFVAGAAR